MSSDNLYISPNGVVYRLEDSPYECYRNGLVFKFSSARHLDKFMSEVRIREEWLTDSLSRRFKVKVDAAIIADFQLYIQLERRGFYVYDEVEGVAYECQEQVELIGLSVRLTNSKKQLTNMLE